MTMRAETAGSARPRPGSFFPTLGEWHPEGAGAFLRRLHPVKTAANVAAETGVPAKTVEKWLGGETQPGLTAFVRLVVAYGPAFLEAALRPPPDWISESARAAQITRLEAEIARLKGAPKAIGALP